MPTAIAAIEGDNTGHRSSRAINAATVGTIYLAQVVAASCSPTSATSLLLHLLPGATLAGYALGVAYCAFAARNLTSARDFVIHLGWLALSLVVASMAQAEWAELLAYVAVGIGCALTQRLLAVVGSTAGDAERSRAIGALIAAGLCGIVVARAGSAMAVAIVGGRILLVADAVLISVLGLVAASAWSSDAAARLQAVTPMSALALWRAHTVLRDAAWQLAVAFAAYNFAWITFVRTGSGTGAVGVGEMATISGIGAAAAIATGQVCSRYRGAVVARLGLGAALLGSAVLFVMHSAPLTGFAAMIVIDAGTQTVLVASQARVQALGPTPSLRGRLAAIITTMGFFGGALGAGVAGLFA